MERLQKKEIQHPTDPTDKRKSLNQPIYPLLSVISFDDLEKVILSLEPTEPDYHQPRHDFCIHQRTRPQGAPMASGCLRLTVVMTWNGLHVIAAFRSKPNGKRNPTTRHARRIAHCANVMGVELSHIAQAANADLSVIPTRAAVRTSKAFMSQQGIPKHPNNPTETRQK